MKYKLKKWYPTLPATWKVGDVITRDAQYYKHDAGLIHRSISWSEVENNPEFWEKATATECKILSFKPNNKCPDLWTEFDTGKWCRNDNGFAATSPYTTSEMLGNPRYSIYSVQRLSDGKIFTVGDQVSCNKPGCYKYFTIDTMFFINPPDTILLRNRDCHIYEYIHNIDLVRTPLFKTEDGVNIFEHSVYHSVYLPTVEYMGGHCAEIPNNGKYTSDACKTFSTKEKAEEYVLMNKPCLSIKEIAPIFGMYHLDNSRTSLDRLTEKLKDLVKSKQ